MIDNDKLDKSSTALIRSFTANNITQLKDNVKMSTKYSMQISTKIHISDKYKKNTILMKCLKR